MDSIVQKRTDLANFFLHEEKEYTKKDILYKEYTVLSFSPREEFIDTIVTPFDYLCVDLSTYEFENTNEFYMKGIITDVDRQDFQTILHVRNKDITVSVTCRDGALRAYDEYFVTGEPVIIKGSIFNERVSLGFLVALNQIFLFRNETRYMQGKSLQVVKDANENDIDRACYGVVVECKWVKTKSGKDMLRGTIHDGEKQRSFGMMRSRYNVYIPEDLKAGDFVSFNKPTHDFFINNMKVVHL